MVSAASSGPPPKTPYPPGTPYIGYITRDVAIAFSILEVFFVGLRYLVIALAISDIIAGATLCTPISYLWDKIIEGGHCVDIPASYRWGTLPNAITDLFMLMLPLTVVWKLHTTQRVKIGLKRTFLTGSI